MAEREVREVHTSSGGGIGILGVVIGALLVIGAVAFYANESGMFAGKSGPSAPSVTVNMPGAPAAPDAPSAPRAPTTTGSGSTGR